MVRRFGQRRVALLCCVLSALSVLSASGCGALIRRRAIYPDGSPQPTVVTALAAPQGGGRIASSRTAGTTPDIVTGGSGLAAAAVGSPNAGSSGAPSSSPGHAATGPSNRASGRVGATGRAAGGSGGDAAWSLGAAGAALIATAAAYGTRGPRRRARRRRSRRRALERLAQRSGAA